MTDRDQARSGGTPLLDGVMKNTRARRAILNALAESHEHPDAETVHALAKQAEPRLSLATVYRNLRELEERGTVIRHTFHSGSANWELARESHDHLVDIESGTIIEFADPDLRRALEAAARALGYRLASTSLALYGVKDTQAINGH